MKENVKTDENSCDKQSGKNKNVKRIVKLFLFALYISAAAFGGGFVSLSLIKENYQKRLKWVTEEETADFSAISQASPGSIAINLSMLVGFKVAGVLGALATVLGSLIPPFFVITALYYFYDAIKHLTLINYLMKGMQAGVSAVILSLVVDLWKSAFNKKDKFSIVVLIVAFLISAISQFLFGVSTVIYVVILSAVLGVAFSYINYFKAKRKANGDKS
ncbi:MAG: chromate transporter [Clostridia bacterium]|nr:chromate transporter [Clostridia bacterium]